MSKNQTGDKVGGMWISDGEKGREDLGKESEDVDELTRSHAGEGVGEAQPHALHLMGVLATDSSDEVLMSSTHTPPRRPAPKTNP